MAKKAVATFKKGDGRTYSKVIKMVKSPKTGAYIFQEEMIPNEDIEKRFFDMKGLFFCSFLSAEKNIKDSLTNQIFFYFCMGVCDML